MTKKKTMTKNKPKRKQKTKEKPRTRVVTVQAPREKSIGSQLGALVGHGIQKFGESVFNRIMGKGDYKLQDNLPSIRKNSLFQNGMNQPPSFAGGATFIFEHSEYITDIVSSSSANTFKTQTFTCNPANATSFPWLSNIATNFESYEIEGMIYRYESTCGNSVASTNTSLGTTMGYFAYDTLDATALSKNVLMQYEGAVDAVTSNSFLIGVECDKSKLVSPRLYVGTPPAGSDAKSYNWGNLVIATSGLQGTSVTVGELYVHYRIKFYTAKQQAASSSISALYSGTTANNPFGSAVESQSGTIITAVVNGTTATFTNMNSGTKYLLTYSLISTTAAFTSGALTYTGATASNEFNRGGNTQLNGSTSPNYFIIEACFIASASTVTIGSSWVFTNVSPVTAQLTLTPFDNVTL